MRPAGSSPPTRPAPRSATGSVAEPIVRVRRTAAVVAVVVAAAAVLPTAAGASRSLTPAQGALGALRHEVALLVDLTAWSGALPPLLTSAHDEWLATASPGDRNARLAELGDADQEGMRRRGDLGAAPLGSDTFTALSTLSPGDMTQLSADAPISIPAVRYVHALEELQRLSTMGPATSAPPVVNMATPKQPQVTQAPVTKPRVTAPAMAVAAAPPTTTAAPATTVATTTSAAGSSGDAARASATSSPTTATDDFPLGWLIGLVVALVVLALVFVVLVARRRRTGEARRLDGSVAQLFDAGRRFGASVDTDEILDILVDETRVLADSPYAAVVLVDPATRAVRSVIESAPGMVRPDGLGRGRIRRTLDTGVATHDVTGDEPGLMEGRHAMVVVPFVRGGALAGAVVACRNASDPYEALDLDLLGQLVPMAATALASVERHDGVAELSLTDGLTELANRRRLDRDLAHTLDGSKRSVGFVMIDIDHFKQFNDTHGHGAGDEVLQGVAALLREHVRVGDVVYRYGGEEFSVLLPDADAVEAAEVAERLRAAVEGHAFEGGETQPGERVTISVGVTVVSGADPVETKDRADRALYDAKRAGRNRVVVDDAVVAG